MPPATAASNPSMTRLRRASSKISAPWWARSALLAVTTCLPAASAFRMNVRAGSSPPDQLDDDLDLRVVEDLVRVADQREPREVEPLARPREIGVGDAAEHEPAARALLHLGAVALKHLDHAAADRAEAEKGDLDVVHHVGRRPWRAVVAASDPTARRGS